MYWYSIIASLILLFVWIESIRLLYKLKVDNEKDGGKFLPRYLRITFSIGIIIFLIVGTILTFGFMFSV